ncbi:MAG: ATP-binding protein [Ekhidna sp.]|uniref:sensor histidine kinase n=1 Tax=Ekhidna sp. TaxID=2608089 RepID=UPI0032EB8B0E
MKRLSGLLTLAPLLVGAKGDEDLPIPEQSVSVCSVQQVQNPSTGEYFANLLTTSNWPARWTCGTWSATDGWIYIISDLTIFAAYLSIPIMLFIYLWRRDLGLFKLLTFSFGVFILACGFTHLIDAIIFWEPIYRFSGFVRAITAVVSVATVGLMIKSIPIALTFKSPKALQLQVDKAVAEAEELNSILQESFSIAKIGTWKLDLKSNVVSWSDSLYDIYEIPLGTPIDLEASLEMYKGQEKLIQDTIANAISAKSKYNLELLLTKPNGSQLWTKAIGIPEVEGDEVVSIRGYVMDIDASKQLEIERKKSREKLEEEVNARTSELKAANQELESFSYYISHDLRAPLRAINGFSEALQEDYRSKLDEEAVRYLDRIAYNSRKMGDLIDDILAFSRMHRKQTNFKKVDLNGVITDIIDHLFVESKAFIEVSPLPEIHGDKEMINQVFANLISNAIKYSSKEESPAIEIAGEEYDDSYLIKITDNGVGFNMQYADKLFMVFQRLHADEEFEGTGVGLALCHKIMSMHDGEIWAKSEEGAGATFFLKFKKQVND